MPRDYGGEVGPQTQPSVFIMTTSAKCLYAATI